MNAPHRIGTIPLLIVASLVWWTSNPCGAAIVSKPILTKYFETGDIPTQQQFGDLIDSFIHRIDDGVNMYLSPDPTGTALRLEANELVGPNLSFLDYTLVSGFSDDWLGQSGFLPISFDLDSQTHYGYVQISPDVPGASNPYAMFVEYLVYDDVPNTSVTTAPVPEPTTAALAMIGILAALTWHRCSRRFFA